MTPTHDDVVRAVELFVRTAAAATDDDRLTRHTDLFDEGYIDSAGVVELIAYLESTFRIRLSEDDLFDERFQSIDGIANIVSRHAGDPRFDTPRSARPAQR